MRSNMDLIPLLVAAFATARLTRLVTTDRLTRAPRMWLLHRLQGRELLSYLVVCDWCVSVYMGLVVALTGAWAGSWPWTWALPFALTFSMVTGLLARWEDE